MDQQHAATNGHHPTADIAWLQAEVDRLRAENHSLHDECNGLSMTMWEKEAAASTAWSTVRDLRYQLLGGGGEATFAIKRADPSKMRPTEFAWTPWIVRGRLNEIVGEERAGKSTFSAYIAAGISNGALPGAFHGRPKDVLFIGADEDSWENDTMPRLRAAGADFAHIHVLEGAALNVQRDAEALGKLLTSPDTGPFKIDGPTRCTFGLIVIEHAMDVLPSMRNPSDPVAMRQAFGPFRRMLREVNVPALQTRHTNKVRVQEFRQAAQGSMQFGAMARSSFLIARHPLDGEKRVAVLGPANYVPEGVTPSLSFRIDSYEFEENGRVFDVGQVVDINEDELTMAEALGATSARSQPAVSVLDQVKAAILDALPAKTKTAAAAKVERRDDDQTFRAAWALLEDDGTIAREDGEWKVVVVPTPRETPPPQLFLEGPQSAIYDHEEQGQ